MRDNALENFTNHFEPIRSPTLADPLALSEESEKVEPVDVGFFEQEGYLFIHNNIDDLEEEVAENQIDVEGAISLVIDGLEETESVDTVQEEVLAVDSDKKKRERSSVDGQSKQELDKGAGNSLPEEAKEDLREKEGVVGAQELFGEEALVGSGQDNNTTEEVEQDDVGEVRQEESRGEGRVVGRSQASNAEEASAEEEFSKGEDSPSEGFVRVGNIEPEDADSEGEEGVAAELLNEESYFDEIESALEG